MCNCVYECVCKCVFECSCEKAHVLHCQSLALKSPLLFSARVFPISVPPAFISFASVVFSVQTNTHSFIIMKVNSAAVYVWQRSVYTPCVSQRAHIITYPFHIGYSSFFWQSLHFHIFEHKNKGVIIRERYLSPIWTGLVFQMCQFCNIGCLGYMLMKLKRKKICSPNTLKCKKLLVYNPYFIALTFSRSILRLYPTFPPPKY